MDFLKVLVVVGIVGALSYVLKLHPEYIPSQNAGPDPDQIQNPVYAQIRVKGAVPVARGRTRDLEMMILVKAADQKDCKAHGDDVTKRFLKADGVWSVSSQECLDTLTPRYQRLFDNESISSAYLSVAHSARGERDFRLVVWGLTVPESRYLMCDMMVKKVQEMKHGAVTCVEPVGT